MTQLERRTITVGHSNSSISSSTSSSNSKNNQKPRWTQKTPLLVSPYVFTPHYILWLGLHYDMFPRVIIVKRTYVPGTLNSRESNNTFYDVESMVQLVKLPCF